jgi:glycosyltransferase involved in cell wall biosynthesis
MGGSGLRVLFVCPYLPSRQSGGRVRLHGLASRIAGSHSVSILSFASPDDPDDDSAVRAWCDEVVTVPTGLAADTRSKRRLQLRSLLSLRSYERLVSDQRAFQQALDRMTAETRYDVVHVESCHMAHYRFPRDVPVVLDEQNIEYEIQRRTAAVTESVPRRLYNRVDSFKVQREEERLWRSVDGVALTSSRDEAAVRAAHPAARTAVVPNAVDLGFFTPGIQRRRPDPLTILFFGTISYFPNTDGVLFFLDEVLPLLRPRYPELEVLIVGASPPDAVQRRAGPGVTVTGMVDDLRPYLERARAIIAPLRIGGGTRLKILEAMAMGGPVVSTTLGAEGLAVEHGRNILIADGAAAFAAAVGRVLDDDRLAADLGSAARRLVEERYDWEHSAATLAALYRSVIDARRDPLGRRAPAPRYGPDTGGELRTNSIIEAP